MRKVFEKFPEVLLVDGTYNVNSIRMPLYCFMAEDGFGKGRVIFYAAVCERWFRCSRNQIQSGNLFV